MIDKVGIGSNSESDFTEACRAFVGGCCNATLNDANQLPRSAAGWAAQGQRLAAEHKFLGEVYSLKGGFGYARNSDKHVDKLTRALDALAPAQTERGAPHTRRNVAAVLGLRVWMARTIGVHFSGHRGFLRLAECVSCATKNSDKARK